MFRQVLIPDEQNSTVTIPAEWFGLEVIVLAFPVNDRQIKEKKQFAWLTGDSKIDNPLYVGKNFRKITREEIYDRKNFH